MIGIRVGLENLGLSFKKIKKQRKKLVHFQFFCINISYLLKLFCDDCFMHILNNIYLKIHYFNLELKFSCSYFM